VAADATGKLTLELPARASVNLSRTN